MSIKPFTTIVGAMLGCSALMPLAAQAEPVHLKLSHPYADTHYLSVEGIKVFAAEIEKRTDGEVKIDLFPASQLGKSQTSLLKSGLVELAYVVPSLDADKLPLSSVMELPALFTSSCDSTQKLWPLMAQGGEITKQEYATQGFRPLYLGMMAQYDVFTTRKRVAEIPDMAGLKLRGNGALISKTLRAFDAVPVSLASSESYDAVTRGTIDGMYFPAGSIHSYSLESQFKHVLTGLQLGGAGAVMVVSEKAFQKLSPKAQEVLGAVGLETQERLCAYVDDQDHKLRGRFATENGMEVIKATPEQSAEWSAKVTHVVSDWIAEMRNARRDGEAVLDTLGYKIGQ